MTRSSSNAPLKLNPQLRQVAKTKLPRGVATASWRVAKVTFWKTGIAFRRTVRTRSGLRQTGQSGILLRGSIDMAALERWMRASHPVKHGRRRIAEGVQARRRKHSRGQPGSLES